MGSSADDIRIRMAAFQWLEAQERIHGDSLPRRLLETGFMFEGGPVRLVGPQGIFKPYQMALPISITTIWNGRYDDGFEGSDLLRYHYRGSDPDHRDNVGLREAMRLGVPLIYFNGFVPGRCIAAWPVYIVGDDRGALAFSVQVDARPDLSRRLRVADGRRGVDELPADDPGTNARRAYITATVRVRLHQQAFHERVMRAYQHQCALCRLRHEELLDAAHIIPDGEPDSEPIVPNGLALCKLHHAAFDQYFFGIRPDLTVEVSGAILREEDGPMLRHGLQGIHGQLIHRPSRPSDRPAPWFLERRYDRFRQRVEGGLR
ncbi:MAG: HNH endonuclease [Acidobacteriia bacterium]|nr:HNH endonuclease [Terriglobia bacterium]